MLYPFLRNRWPRNGKSPRRNRTVRPRHANVIQHATRLQFVHDHVGYTRGIILSGLIIFSVAGGIGALAWEVLHNQVQIEPLTVPKSLSDRGYTGKVIASLLALEAEKIKQGASTSMKRMRLETSWTQQDIVVPGAELSLKSAGAFIKSYFGLASTAITGSLGYPNLITEKPRKIRLRLAISREGLREVSLDALETDLDTLILNAAREMMRWTDPYVLASYFYRINEKAESEKVCKLVFKEFQMTEHEIRCHNLLGIMFYDEKKYDEAIAAYIKVIKMDPNFAEAFSNRGNAYQRKRQFDRAIQDYDRAIELKTDYAVAFSNRGNAYQRKRQFDRAIQDYDRAIELKTDYAVAFSNRGNAYRRKRQFDRAVQDYDRAIDLKPDYALAFRNRGTVYEKLGRKKQAIRDYKRAYELGSRPDWLIEKLRQFGVELKE